MDLYPKLILDKVTDIHIGMLKELDIRGLILDVDNTLIDLNRNIIPNAKEWCNDLKRHGINFCIVSNSGSRSKVEWIASVLEIPYIYFARKPFKGGFIKAKLKMQLSNKNIAVVGDQILTDVIGANSLDMYSILTKPISKKESILTKIKRPLENKIINKYLEDKYNR